MTAQDGIFAPGLGVVTEAKVESCGFPNPLGETEATVSLTFASGHARKFVGVMLPRASGFGGRGRTVV